MKIPGPINGVVRVAIPKVNIWIGLLGVPIAYSGTILGSWLLLAIGIGTLSVMPIGISLQWLAELRLRRKIAHWPVQVQIHPNDDGERVAFITSTDGTVSTMILPEGYDPSDDDGEWFIRQVAPDLAQGLFDDEEDE